MKEIPFGCSDSFIELWQCIEFAYSFYTFMPNLAYSFYTFCFFVSKI